MKKFLIILLNFAMATAIAEDLRETPSKTMEEILQSRCLSITGADGTAVTVNDLIEAIIGPGISYSNVSYQGVLGDASLASMGLFSNADCVPLGFNEGIVLSTGRAGDVVGPNTICLINKNNGLPGDPQLTALSGAIFTHNASWLQFDFVPTENTVYIQYVFTSTEYSARVFPNTFYDDIVGIFVNGSNIALVPGTNFPVSIRNINYGLASCNTCGNPANGTNPQFFRDNGCAPYPFNIQANGLTTVLTGIASVNPGVTNTIKIAIADGQDRFGDSWVFFKGGSFSVVDPNAPPPVPLSNWALYLGILFAVTFIVIRFRKMI